MRIGVLGAGQLGQMLAESSRARGHSFVFYNPTPSASVGGLGEIIVGDFGDLTLLEEFVSKVDVVTFEFENVPVETVEWLEKSVPVRPSGLSLKQTQNRIEEKRLFERLNIPCAQFGVASNSAELADALQLRALPVVVKTARFGYDGKGQWFVRTEEDARSAVSECSTFPVIVEEAIAFEKEVSVVAVRSQSGEIRFYPINENIHRDGILRYSITPGRVAASIAEQAMNATRAIMDSLQHIGVLTVEFFVSANTLYANEIAPRVHNTGHGTIESCATSQFENHVRAVVGEALGATDLVRPALMVNIIGAHGEAQKLSSNPNAHVHDYSKEERTGRKLGHCTWTGDSVENVINLLNDPDVCEIIRRY